ncbi:MAG: hypothetical protein K6T83_10490 [Alicyclobacillus sp.]|nr:hypothetical protein [Alicyclobacillus sp.]
MNKRMPSDGSKRNADVQSLVGTDSPDDFEYEGQFAELNPQANMPGEQAVQAGGVVDGDPSATRARRQVPHVTVDNPDDFE